ncbi:MAG TPA: mannosyltransferase family protein [Candidatus Baltobacteraceae bacterium]|nr:mannosyltransferase family protein [Candidatus Baltobacteraceae bacterium]
MSAQVTFTETLSRRGSRLIECVAASGIVASLLVAIGGAGIGFFLWYVAVTHVGLLSAGGDFTFVLALTAGVALAFAGWFAYGDYFARRAGVGIVTAMRWDAVSWMFLGLFVAGAFLPVQFGTPGRSAAVAAALFGLSKILVAARFVPTVRDVLVVFIVTRLPIIAVAELASAMIGQRSGTHVAESANPLLAVWGRWDAVHYLDIARRGYYGTDMAFFPLYPLLIRFVGAFVGNELLAGMIISNVALFFALLFFYKLVEHQFDRAVAHRAIFYISIFPTAVFFSAAYTESLFFMLTVASFYYIREHNWLRAGLLGALAALTRVEGVLLAVPYLIEVFTSDGAGSWRRWFSTRRGALEVILGALAIPAGLGAYMLWLWVLRGDPLYFSHVQAHWNRHLAWPYESIWHSLKAIATSHVAATVSAQVIELAFTALMISVLIAGFWRLRPSLSAYMTLSIVVPMSTSSLMSMPRFALVLFPMFMILALWGKRPWVNNAIVAFSLPLLGLFTVLFADWYWVA